MIKTRVSTSGVAAIGGAVALATALAGYGASSRPRPNADILALSAQVTSLTHEFSALEVQRFVPPTQCAALDAYSMRLEGGAHKLEDTTAIAITLPLYDLSVARTREDRSAAIAHLQHGLHAVRAVIDDDIGLQQEWNEIDVLARLHIALMNVERLAR